MRDAAGNDATETETQASAGGHLHAHGAQSRSLFQDAARQFLRHRLAVVGLVMMAIYVIGGIAAPILAPHDPMALDYGSAFVSPNSDHFMGTDQLGRDVFSRILYATRLDLGLSLSAVTVAIVMGLLIGVPSAYFRGWLDSVLMRLVDVLLAFPSFIFALALVAFVGPSTLNILVVLAVTHAPRYARLVRGSVLSVNQQEYVQAARVIGATDSTIMRRHIVPNSLTSTIVYGTLDLGIMIISLAGLSFLGIGIQPPTPDWGLMLTDARSNMVVAPWTAIFPGVAISLAVIAFNIMGDGLRDALDPRMRV